MVMGYDVAEDPVKDTVSHEQVNPPFFDGIRWRCHRGTWRGLGGHSEPDLLMRDEGVHVPLRLLRPTPAHRRLPLSPVLSAFSNVQRVAIPGQRVARAVVCLPKRRWVAVEGGKRVVSWFFSPCQQGATRPRSPPFPIWVDRRKSGPRPSGRSRLLPCGIPGRSKGC